MKISELRKIIKKEVKRISEVEDLEPVRSAERPGKRCYSCEITGIYTTYWECVWSHSMEHRSSECLSWHQCANSCKDQARDSGDSVTAGE